MEEMLLECSVVTEYVDAILLDERESLEDPAIFQFMQHYYPKVRCYHTNTLIINMIIQRSKFIIILCSNV